MDSYGPVTDNAQSVYELSQIERRPGIREDIQKNFGFNPDFENGKYQLEKGDGAGNTFQISGPSDQVSITEQPPPGNWSISNGTGAFATLLNRGFVRSLHVPLHQTPFSSAAVNLKQRGVAVARIRHLSVGSVDIVGKDVGVVDLEGLIHGGLLQGSPPVAGLLGAEILNRHHGIIDFGTRTLYLKR